MSAIISVVYFLIALVFDLAIFFLWARIALRYFKVSSLHPVSHLIESVTAPLIKPLEQFLYSTRRAPGQYDWLSFSLIVGVELAKFITLGFLAYRQLLPVPYILLFTLGDLIIQPCNFLFYIILARVIMSWVNPTSNHPIMYFIVLISEPLLKLGRRIIPDISGFDFSPFLIMIVLKVIILFTKNSLPFYLG